MMNTQRTRVAAIKILREEATRCGLPSNYSIRLNGRLRKCLGRCFYDGRIEINRRYALCAPLERLVDTVRHEIAHAIAGYTAGHGPAWKSVAQRLGCVPEAMAHMPEDGDWSVLGIRGWYGSCPVCGAQNIAVLGSRPRRARYHTPCGTHAILTWKKG